MKKEGLNKGEIVIYKTKDGPILQVRFEKDSVWLDAHLIAKLFDVNRPAIVKHINNIYKTGELEKKSTCSILEQVAADGKENGSSLLLTFVEKKSLVLANEQMMPQIEL